jgi:hypothetical protein
VITPSVKQILLLKLPLLAVTADLLLTDGRATIWVR